ncbi:hypothetical protein P152DRAFT_396082, partial [Eremomyces bilateralis CBS 781.70]
ITGQLVRANTSNIASLDNRNIAFISCDPSDYPPTITVAAVLNSCFERRIRAAVLYTKTLDYCAFDNRSRQSFSQVTVYSMSNPSVADMVGGSIDMYPETSQPALIARTSIAQSIYNGTQQPPSFGSVSPSSGGGSPQSTAVAMIILYSITGVITALFLIIIVTGAVRAHRHPERYGPRNVPGRPRQSRAKGIARAMLETLPIVKWGETEPPKERDTELGNAASRSSETSTADGGAPKPTGAITVSTGGTNERSETDGIDKERELEAGPKPDSIVEEGPSRTSQEPKDEGIGCSICTEEFEKGEEVRVLPCDHKYHPQCIDPWLLNVSGTCPLCRVDLRAPDSTAESQLQPDPSDPSTPTQPSDTLAPPPVSANPRSSRRFSAIRDLLNRHHMLTASREERIAALQLVRQQSRAQEQASGGASGENGAANRRRSRGLTARVADVLQRRSRREEEMGDGGASASTAAPERDAPR